MPIKILTCYMKKIFILVLFITSLNLHAQQSIAVTSPSGNVEEIDIPENMTLSIDSLLSNWHAKNYLSISPEDCNYEDVNPTYPDSIYIDRLSRIPTIMEMPYNDIVRKFIDMYSGRLRKSVSYMLGASNFYMPIFEQALDLYNLPYELKYLPIIESALNPTAVSRQGATGLWQFMLGTGKIYGLETNSLIDERRDPIKATYAAARYLNDLYEAFQDWNLVIAAYNCGPGTVNKAIHRANGARDYWSIYNYLPKETRGYVPAFIAANYIMNYYCDHNICPMDTQLPLATDTIHINRELHFQQISDLCNIDLESLHALNPQYKTEIIPGNSGDCILRLPHAALTAFIDAKDSVYTHRADELFNNRRQVAVQQPAARAAASTAGAKYYKIRRGDTLSEIAEKFGTSVRRLRSLNGIRGNRITAGKSIRVR